MSTPTMEAFFIVPPPAEGKAKTPRSARYFRRPPGPIALDEDMDKYCSQSKTERWRESGQLRWPPLSAGAPQVPPPGGGPEIVPVRQYNKNPQNWQVELWTRSLRKPGVLLQHPTFAAVNIGAKELHEQWGHVMPLSRRQWPFSGSTVAGRSGPADAKSWIERPVATGKYALDHMGGTRYKWNMSPRPCLADV